MNLDWTAGVVDFCDFLINLYPRLVKLINFLDELRVAFLRQAIIKCFKVLELPSWYLSKFGAVNVSENSKMPFGQTLNVLVLVLNPFQVLSRCLLKWDVLIWVFCSLFDAFFHFINHRLDLDRFLFFHFPFPFDQVLHGLKVSRDCFPVPFLQQLRNLVLSWRMDKACS